MNTEHNCVECKHGIWNCSTEEWECRYANIPNREECNEDFEAN